jgi:hypothetical protein
MHWILIKIKFYELKKLSRNFKLFEKSKPYLIDALLCVNCSEEEFEKSYICLEKKRENIVTPTKRSLKKERENEIT